MIPFCKATLGEAEEQAVLRVMRSGWLAAGQETEAFEREFAAYVGVKHAIFTNSGTSALKIAYKYHKHQNEAMGVIVGIGINYPVNTFCATYSAAREVGIEALPRIVRLDDNFGARVNMHYGGVKDETPCFLEDSAHRIEPNDPLVGKIRIYSFYVTKNMTTGAGGMLVTDDDEIATFARLCWKDGLTSSTADRQSGKSLMYEVKLMAGGYDGNDLAAAIGREQLKKLPSFTAKRNAIVAWYNDAFEQDWTGNHLYPYFVDSMDEVESLLAFLKTAGIGCGYHYPGTGWLAVSLPLFPLMTDAEVKTVIKEVLRWRTAYAPPKAAATAAASEVSSGS